LQFVPVGAHNLHKLPHIKIHSCNRDLGLRCHLTLRTCLTWDNSLSRTLTTLRGTGG